MKQNNKIAVGSADNKQDLNIIVLKHQLDYVMDFLMDEYYKTWNPFKKIKMRNIMNRFHKYMYPTVGDLFETGK
jgi:hypothetical protein